MVCLVDFFIALAAVAAVSIPGTLAVLAVLKGLPLSVFERLIFAVSVGLGAVPALAALEFVLLGMPFTVSLVVLNAALLLVVSVAALYLQGQLASPFGGLVSAARDVASLKPSNWEAFKAVAFPLAVLLLTAFAFNVRFSTSWDNTFFEFDPVFYAHITDLLVRTGDVPFATTEVYYPIVRNLRSYPLMPFAEASWYGFYRIISGLPYAKFDVQLVSQLYPPLVGALMVLLAYVFISKEYGKWIGAIAAAVFVSTPQLVAKFGAGEMELQPWALFSTLLLFALYSLALKYRSRRLGLLVAATAVLSILGSAQSLWTINILVAVMALNAVISFIRNQMDESGVFTVSVVSASSLLAFLVVQAFQVIPRFTVSPPMLLMAGALALHLVLFAILKFSPGQYVGRWHFRMGILAGMGILALVAALLFPAVFSQVTGLVNTVAGFAKTGSALSKTIAEENATSSAQYFGSFGNLNPDLLLPLSCLLLVVSSAITVYRSNREKRLVYAALASLALMTLVVFGLNAPLDSLLNNIHGAFGSLSFVADFVTQSDVFTYFLLSLFAVVIQMAFSGESGSSTSLILVMLVFPIAFIGLNKLKFLLHLAFALTLLFPFLLGVALSIISTLAGALPDESDRKMSIRVGLGILLLVGVFVSYAQAGTLKDSTAALQATRISPDWMEAYDWMRTTPDMTEQACISEYGYDCRVLSWWDYGHWTVFFGETKSVLDPGNARPDFDQETARAFVNGNLSNLAYTANYHQATHILLDAQLIQKWGALVFLSGSCSRKESVTCPETPEIDYTGGAGRSAYEAEHFYELLYSKGRCPAALTGVPMEAFQSSITGAVYCFGSDSYIAFTQAGLLVPGYSRKFKIVGRDQVDSANLDQSVSYLFPYTDGAFLNANPDISYAGLNNTFLNSAFARLYLFEYLPGLPLAHRSPHGEVKVFKITKDFLEGKAGG